jgi:hypothetical protein
MMPPMMAQPAEMAGPPPNVEGVMPEETGGGLAATGTPDDALLAMLGQTMGV